jgi:hypothetical protein
VRVLVRAEPFDRSTSWPALCSQYVGLLPRILELGYRVQQVRFVDRNGRTTGGFSTDVLRRMTNDRFATIQRSDLSSVIHDALDVRGREPLRRLGGSVVKLVEK